MTWFDTVLTEDQREVVELAAGLVAALSPLENDGGEDLDAAVQARDALVESGLWSLGVDDAAGGGGASFALRQAAFAALGSALPALTWASVHTHAAATVLTTADTATLREHLVSGVLPIAVVDMHSIGVDIAFADGRASGNVARVDPAGERAALVVLDGPTAAWVILPDGVRLSDPLRRTGFAAARTSAAAVDAGAHELIRIDGVDADAARTVLRTGAVAIAAGISVDAAQRAISYAHSRNQFGGPLTALPTMRTELAAQAARATALLDAALTADVPSHARAAAAHVSAVDAAIDAAGAAIQVHGGYGYLREYGVERLLRDAISLRAASGADSSALYLADAHAPVRTTGL